MLATNPSTNQPPLHPEALLWLVQLKEDDFKPQAHRRRIMNFVNDSTLSKKEVKKRKDWGQSLAADVSDFEKRERLKSRLELMKETRRVIEYLTGLRPKQLLEVINDFEGDSEEWLELIEKEIIRKSSFLNRAKEGDEEIWIKDLAKTADAYVNNIIKDFSLDKDDTEMHNEVDGCSSIKDLLRFAFKKNTDKVMQFEALRKLSLMLIFAEIKDYNKEDEISSGALTYMERIFERKILYRPKGIPSGTTYDRYMITSHSEDTFKTLKADIVDKKNIPEDLDPLTKVTRLRSRSMIVENELGEKRQIYFSYKSREKSDEGRATKALRGKGRVGESDVDLNGAQLIFENAEDWRAAKPKIMQVICSEGDVKDIEIYEEKGSLDGSESFEGNDPNSAKDLKTFKFKMRVIKEDGKTYNYEFQIYTLEGYADIKYGDAVSWEEYKVNRTFAGVIQLLFPKKIYGLDYKKAQIKAINAARSEAWNGQAHLIETKAA